MHNESVQVYCVHMCMCIYAYMYFDSNLLDTTVPGGASLFAIEHKAATIVYSDISSFATHM